MRVIFEKTDKRADGRWFDRKIARYLHGLSSDFIRERGGPMVVFANDQIGIHINLYGVYERKGLDTLFAFLEPVMPELKAGTVLDIGANIGNHSLYFARRFNRVIAFEPHPLTYEVLGINTRQYENVLTFNHGISDSTGTATLFENAINMGASTVREDKSTNQNRQVIALKSLDELDIELGSVELIKIDVEGHEANVLNGSATTLKQHQPIILLEQHRGEFDGQRNVCVDALKALGYRFCWHRSRTQTRPGPLRPFYSMLDAVFGAHQQVWSSDEVPRGNYPMLIAVPARFHQVLLDRS